MQQLDDLFIRALEDKQTPGDKEQAADIALELLED